MGGQACMCHIVSEQRSSVTPWAKPCILIGVWIAGAVQQCAFGRASHGGVLSERARGHAHPQFAACGTSVGPREPRQRCRAPPWPRAVNPSRPLHWPARLTARRRWYEAIYVQGE